LLGGGAGQADCPDCAALLAGGAGQADWPAFFGAADFGF
jgi:hypothetical protein